MTGKDAVRIPAPYPGAVAARAAETLIAKNQQAPGKDATVTPALESSGIGRSTGARAVLWETL
jgi:hypothetical protein